MFNLKTTDKFLNTSFLTYLKSAQLPVIATTVQTSYGLKTVTLLGQPAFALKSSLISLNYPISNTFLKIVRNGAQASKGGFFVELILKGIGFKVFRFGDYLFLQLGFSHFYVYILPKDLVVKAKRDRLVIFGMDKQKVGNVTHEICSLRVPDAYKAKGIQYKNRDYRLKEGKKK